MLLSTRRHREHAPIEIHFEGTTASSSWPPRFVLIHGYPISMGKKLVGKTPGGASSSPMAYRSDHLTTPAAASARSSQADLRVIMTPTTHFAGRSSKV